VHKDAKLSPEFEFPLKIVILFFFVFFVRVINDIEWGGWGLATGTGEYVCNSNKSN
jgi:hypothetical protein